MSSPVNHQNRKPLARHPAGRLAAWLLMVMFAWQLIAATQHHHDLSKQASDCVSCYIAGHLPSDLPTVDVTPVAASEAALVYRIILAARYSFVAPVSFLIPHGQAPPRSSLTA